jgi:hypothetical protein
MSCAPARKAAGMLGCHLLGMTGVRFLPRLLAIDSVEPEGRKRRKGIRDVDNIHTQRKIQILISEPWLH